MYMKDVIKAVEENRVRSLCYVVKVYKFDLFVDEGDVWSWYSVCGVPCRQNPLYG